MKNLAIARRYAKALLLIGKEDDQTDTYRRELEMVARIVAREEQLAYALSNPLYDAVGRKKLLAASIGRLDLSKARFSSLSFCTRKSNSPRWSSSSINNT